jgi:ABC-type Fe3+ transport system substrate-binding protein
VKFGKEKGIARIVAALAVLVVISAGVGAYGWLRPTPSTSGVTTVTQTESLVQEAKAECANVSTCLTIYSSADLSEWQQDQAPTFYAAYPWATGKVSYLSLNAAQLTSRGISEYKAGKVQADIFSATLGIVYPIILAGGVQNYSNPMVQLMNYSAGSYDPDGAWVVIGLSLITMQYNPNIIPANEVPHSFSDLANPVYSGKIVFQSAASLSATTGVFYYLYTQMGNSSGQWTSLMQKIAANHPVITPSASQATDDVAGGEAGICICLYNDYLEAASGSNGTNIQVVITNPTIYNPQVVSIAKNAPHPAMAELFEQWFMGAAGQAGHALSGRTPIQVPIADYYGLIPKGVVLVNAYSNPAIFQNPGAWSDTFKNIFGA